MVTEMRARGFQMNIQDAANYSVSEVLRNGEPALIRAIRPNDKQRLLCHFQGLSPRSVYFRFFGCKRSLSDADLRRFTELDFINHVGLAATIGSDEDEKFIGVGRYIRRDSIPSAEVAFAVLDSHQGHGIGTLLLKHLATIARTKGITRFEADVMGSNQQMLEVFANSGFQEHESNQAGVVHVILDLDHYHSGAAA
jgi:GNAT superfamily N-acetyltransferase